MELVAIANIADVGKVIDELLCRHLFERGCKFMRRPAIPFFMRKSID